MRGSINICLIQDSQKNIFLIKNVLKSYVLKPTSLFNKVTWEKEGNTQSTTIFVTTEIHENKMVIHEIGTRRVFDLLKVA